MQRPIVLVCGLPRSGTTWIGKTLDSHPDTLYLHEPDSVRRLRGVPVAPNMSSAQTYRTALQEYLDGLPRVLSAKVNGTLPVFRKRCDTAFAPSLRKAVCLGAKASARVFGEFPLPPLMRASAQRPLVWKSIESLGRLGLFARLSGQVRVIHILRHPCGYVASVKRGDADGRFDDRASASEDLEYFELLLHTEQARRYDITMTRLQRMAPIERLAWRWVLLNEKAMNDCAGFPGYHLVRYEDFCEFPLPAFQQLFRSAGLAWHAQIEAFIRASVSNDDDAYYAIRKNPLRAATKWRAQLTAEEIAQVLEVVGHTQIGRFYSTPRNAADRPAAAHAA